MKEENDISGGKRRRMVSVGAPHKSSRLWVAWNKFPCGAVAIGLLLMDSVGGRSGSRVVFIY